MKLLEPVAGIKTAQGHALFHFVFFCMIWSVKVPDACSAVDNTRADVTPDAAGGEYFTTFMQGTENAEGHHTAADDATNFHSECRAFETIKWSHFTTFLLQVLYISLKMKEIYNLAQFI